MNFTTFDALLGNGNESLPVIKQNAAKSKMYPKSTNAASSYFSDTEQEERKECKVSRYMQLKSKTQSRPKVIRSNKENVMYQEINFPQVRQVLWDRTATGRMVTIRPYNVIPEIHVVAKVWDTLDVAKYLVVDEHEENEIRISNVAKEFRKRSIPVLESSGFSKEAYVTRLNEYVLGMRRMDDVKEMLPIKAQVMYRKENIGLRLETVLPTSALVLTPIHTLPIWSNPTYLQLMKDTKEKWGYVTLNETRKVVLLSIVDPLVFQRPIVGVWVAGVKNANDSNVLWSVVLAYLANSMLKDKVFMDNKTFLVIVIHRKETSCFECFDGSKSGLYFSAYQSMHWYDDSIDHDRTIKMPAFRAVEVESLRNAATEDIRVTTDESAFISEKFNHYRSTKQVEPPQPLVQHETSDDTQSIQIQPSIVTPPTDDLIQTLSSSNSHRDYQRIIVSQQEQLTHMHQQIQELQQLVSKFQASPPELNNTVTVSTSQVSSETRISQTQHDTTYPTSSCTVQEMTIAEESGSESDSDEKINDISMDDCLMHVPEMDLPKEVQLNTSSMLNTSSNILSLSIEVPSMRFEQFDSSDDEDDDKELKAIEAKYDDLLSDSE